MNKQGTCQMKLILDRSLVMQINETSYFSHASMSMNSISLYCTLDLEVNLKYREPFKMVPRITNNLLTGMSYVIWEMLF